MIGLLQRVSRADVSVAGQSVAHITQGVLVFVGVEKTDGRVQAERLIDRVLSYRIFADAQGKMNLHVVDIRGGVLLVPQFTLLADTRKGTRPSFSDAAPPETSRVLFQHCVDVAQQRHAPVAAGVFAAEMQVALINDGPVTFWIEV